MRAINRRKTIYRKESGSFWLSFSDMMSVLVLIFIFVIFSMMLSLAEQKKELDNTKTEYEQALLRLDDQKKELKDKKDELADKKKELEDKEDELENIKTEYEQALSRMKASEAELKSQLSTEQEENEELYSRIQMLEGNESEQQAKIDTLLRDIESQKKELDSLGIQYNDLLLSASQAKQELASAQTVMSTQSQQLSSYQQEIERQQMMLEQMVGVKAQLIEELSNELRRNHVEVSVDEQTGAITLPSEMLFAVGQNELSHEGKTYLNRFLPVYLNVLLSDEFKPYIAEIVIEGHTDSTGKAGVDPYLYNLQLSQQRALSVSNYVLDEYYMRTTLGLSYGEIDTLRTLITASGRSYSALITYADGRENKDASRRVEIKFRLKDDQTIDATEALLNMMSGF